MKVSVLYRLGRTLILFDFNCDENEDDIEGLLEFHFCEKNDFKEMVMEQSRSIFTDFYGDSNGDIPELINYEEILND